ncbi:MAG: LCP family protein [Oscillospiraceae bacterium]|nr:LCP family protein [Oscillospiraceae bacterium]
MKFSGNRRSGRHLSENVVNVPDGTQADNIDSKSSKKKTRSKGPKRWIKIALLSVGVIILAAGAVLALDLFTDAEIIITAPAVNPTPRPSVSRPGNSDNQTNPSDSEGPVMASMNSPDEILEYEREEGRFFTFLIFGLDEGEANTDVIMAATLDTVENSLNVVSIPRDTLVNVPWRLKIANSIFPNMRARYRSESDRELRHNQAMQASVEMFADILGFEVDFWVTVNMRAFTTLIDAVGGINFYVPVSMNYRDNYAGLHINFRRGMHYGLTGRQSLEILRYRSFATGDIGRINIQQQFLSSAVEQVLAQRRSLGTPSNIANIIDIAFNDVRTNIGAGSALDRTRHLAWFATQFFELEPENIRFATIPHHMNDFIVNHGYVVINLDEWLVMLNEMLNPFAVDKVAEDLSILSRGADNRLFSSDGNWAGDPQWGASSRGPNVRQSGSGALQQTGGGGGGGGQAAAPRAPAASTAPAPSSQAPAENNGGSNQTGTGTPGNNASDSTGEQTPPGEHNGEDILYYQINGDGETPPEHLEYTGQPEEQAEDAEPSEEAGSYPNEQPELPQEQGHNEPAEDTNIPPEQQASDATAEPVYQPLSEIRSASIQVDYTPCEERS